MSVTPESLSFLNSAFQVDRKEPSTSVLRAARRSQEVEPHTLPPKPEWGRRGTEGKGRQERADRPAGGWPALPQSSTHGQEPALPSASMERTGFPSEGGALGMGSSRDQPRGFGNFCPARPSPPPISRAQCGPFKSPPWEGSRRAGQMGGGVGVCVEVWRMQEARWGTKRWCDFHLRLAS